MTIRFTVEGAPRSKKTSPRLVKIKTSKGVFNKILPSKAYEAWHKVASQQAYQIKSNILRAGIVLPITVPVSINAQFYRDANRGDCSNLYQGIADWMQDVGIIEDDDQIEHWDGSRRHVDKTRPRIEVSIQIISQAQGELL